MEQITGKTITVASGSSIILSVLVILITLGVLYFVFSAMGINALNIEMTGFVMIILGIATYYLAFSALSWLFLKKQANNAAV